MVRRLLRTPSIGYLPGTDASRNSRRRKSSEPSRRLNETTRLQSWSGSFLDRHTKRSLGCSTDFTTAPAHVLELRNGDRLDHPTGGSLTTSLRLCIDALTEHL